MAMPEKLRPRSQAGAPPSTSAAIPVSSGGFASTSEGARNPGSNSDPAEPGTPVEVEWGNELFQPLAYHGFNTGSFKARGVVRAGESVADAVYRLWLELNTVAMRIRDEKSSAYLREVERLATETRK